MKFIAILGMLFAGVIALLAFPTVSSLVTEGTALSGNVGTFFHSIPTIYVIIAVVAVFVGAGLAAWKMIAD